ncbi:MAG: small ribosomal subunit biogenesis GTPase RsgA [Cellvibrionaceae bacterium]
MSKRKLTKRQAWRIDKIQQERAARAAKRDSDLDGQLNAEPDNSNTSDSALGPEQEGLIIAHYGTQVEVEPSSQSDGSLITRKRCHFRSNLGSLVTGDKVIWRDAEPYGVVVAVQPRSSELSRPDPYGDMKTVAANIDRLLVVIAPIPKPHTQLVDRYLVAAETLGITPVIIINKMDLVNEDNTAVIENFVTLYSGLGYEVIQASTKGGLGLSPLETFLQNYTSVFVGQSGVGKSSLINMLIPDLNLQVGAISEANQKGVHTTTTAQLFHFPQGGHLIDSPGIRELGLWHMKSEEIIEGFIEFRPFIGHCKFRDCQHKQEPGCAIIQAYEAGEISEYRMSSFEELRNSTQ